MASTIGLVFYSRYLTAYNDLYKLNLCVTASSYLFLHLQHARFNAGIK